MSAPDLIQPFVNAVIRPEIRATAAYHVAPAEGMIKLDAMESPYALPLALRELLGRELADTAVNRYPDGSAKAVKEALRVAMKIAPGLDIVLGNGSDEIIQMLAFAVARPGAVMLAPAPSFVMFEASAKLAGLRYVGIPLKPDFSLDGEAMLAAIKREQPALTFIAFPNNPTGNLFDIDTLTRLIAASPGLVVIDEAYSAFADDSFLPRLGDFPNLLVMRTLSKLGLAGIRLGFAVGAPAWISEINKIRPPYNINSLTQVMALRILQRIDLLEAQALTIKSERARVREALAGLPGVTVYPSAANFLLLRVNDSGAAYQGLKSRGILVKNAHGWDPLLSNCLRATIGTPDENDALIGALTDLLRRV